MTKILIVVFSFLILANPLRGQDKVFKDIINIAHTEVKNQQRTGTCWAFATASFFESEILRISKKKIDISEMYVARCIYENKATNYFLRQGKANFSEGGLSHDFVNAMYNYGLVPQNIYQGKPKGEKTYNHGELAKILSAYINAAVKSKLHTDYCMEGFRAILDVYLGEKPENFIYNNIEYTPKSFVASLNIKAKDYIEITSFTHHPFYKYFVLEIPDNFSSGMYYNIKIQELKNQIDHALENGYSISWDGDVSEEGFGRKSGIIKLSSVMENKILNAYSIKDYEKISKIRQSEFEKIKTTDDHLMHLIGKAKDQNGKIYYIIKNSWGKAGDFDGYYYMSEAYLLLKTIAIMIHKDALMQDIKPEIYLPEAIY